MVNEENVGGETFHSGNGKERGGRHVYKRSGQRFFIPFMKRKGEGGTFIKGLSRDFSFHS